MTRTLWIVALVGALACFVGGAVYFALAWYVHGRLSAAGALVLVAAFLLLWVVARYVRFRIDEALHHAQEQAAADSSTASTPTEPLHN